MLKIIYIVILASFVSSCALKRHQSSGYAGYNPGHSAGGYESSSYGGMPGIAQGISTGDSENLKRKESHLTNQQEIKQYYKYKPLLKTDAQRLEFLNQPNIEARNNYANRILFPVEKRDFSAKELDMISKRDISVGMSKRAVEESWGNPMERMPAGDAMRGNEMWIYKKLIPTSNGYNSEYRHVYFESGHVAGWETKK